MATPLRFVRAFYTLPTEKNEELDHLGHVCLFYEVGDEGESLSFGVDHISIVRDQEGDGFKIIFPGRHSAGKRRFDTVTWPSRSVRLAAEEAVRRTVQGSMNVISFDLSKEVPLTPTNGYGRVVCRFSDTAERDNFEFRRLH